MITQIITCKECGKENPHYNNKKLCKRCYMKQWRKENPNYDNNWKHKNKICQPMDQNKSCPQYLGIVIAEQLLIKVFNKVEIMPNNHKGYDFIGDGMKIDAKASCRYLIKNQADKWKFNIRKNKIPNYFICLAFDNRTDLNPEHIWLIPGNKINDKFGIGISESKLNKYIQYELNI